MWWHMTHRRGSEGETGEWSGSPVLFTLPQNMVYPALLMLMRTIQLPVVDWTDASADLNWLVHFAERWKLVPARVPSHFKHSLQPAHGLHQQFWSYGQQLFDESTYLQMDHEIVFHLLDLTVLNNWIWLSSCGAKYTHWDFRLLLVRNLIEEAGKSQYHPTPRLVGRPTAAATNVVRLKSHHNQQWPA